MALGGRSGIVWTHDILMDVLFGNVYERPKKLD